MISNMNKIKAAVVGYGTIGKYVVEALEAAPDFEVAGIVRRASSVASASESKYPVVSSLEQLEKVDVAILCTPSRLVEKSAEEALKLGISTVDSYDIHSGIADTRGTQEATRWFVHSWRYAPHKVSPTPTSAQV